MKQKVLIAILIIGWINLVVSPNWLTTQTAVELSIKTELTSSTFEDYDDSPDPIIISSRWSKALRFQTNLFKNHCSHCAHDSAFSHIRAPPAY